MYRKLIRSLPLTVVSVVVALCFQSAHASRCDAHFPFDGSLADATGNGYDGMMIAEAGAAEARFGEGRYGQALHLTGGSAMRAFLDLHHESCPQFTITAWFRLPSVTNAAPQAILSTGARGGIPAIVAQGSTIHLYGSGNGLAQKNAIRSGDTWFFVAATFDYETRSYKLYWRNRAQEGTLSESPYEAEDSFWIGTRSDTLRYLAQDLFVDDVRVYGRVLELDEIRDTSRNAMAHGTSGEQTRVAAITGESSAVPVRTGGGPNIDLPDGAVGTRPPLGDVPDLPANPPEEPSDFNSPGEQIADPSSQAVIYGTVLDSTGQGVPDTLVCVRRAANKYELATTRSGSDGRFAVAVFAAEPVLVEFRNLLIFPHAGVEYAGRTWNIDEARAVKIEPGQQVEINPEFQLYTCRFSGSVKHASGLPLPGIRVGLYQEGSFDPQRPRPFHSVTTDGNGNFIVELESLSDWMDVQDGIAIRDDFFCTDCRSGLWMDVQVNDPGGSYASSSPSERVYMVGEAHSGLSGHDQCNNRELEFTME